MILVVGGIAQGKRTYVLSLGYYEGDIGTGIHDDKPVLVGLEEILRTGPLTNEDLAILASKEVVVCCEVGLGVVPVDANDRAWRELVGRTCSILARQATTVVRMICGIPVTLA